MYITSENGIEKYASDQKLWPKQNRVSKFGHFLCILAHFEAENGPSRGSTSHGLPELILIFLESVEPGEWD